MKKDKPVALPKTFTVRRLDDAARMKLVHNLEMFAFLLAKNQLKWVSGGIIFSKSDLDGTLTVKSDLVVRDKP